MEQCSHSMDWQCWRTKHSDLPFWELWAELPTITWLLVISRSESYLFFGSRWQSERTPFFCLHFLSFWQSLDCWSCDILRSEPYLSFFGSRHQSERTPFFCLHFSSSPHMQIILCEPFPYTRKKCNFFLTAAILFGGTAFVVLFMVWDLSHAVV